MYLQMYISKSTIHAVAFVFALLNKAMAADECDATMLR